LTFQYEPALLAAAEHSDDAAGRAIRTALRTQAQYRWRQRLERRVMMQQARHRVGLEAAQAAADVTAAQDALTGLGNRRQFDWQIATVDESYSLVLIDVDHFKAINDTFSHQTGDRILREVAATLRAHCRAGDTAVRLGGDEFALFLRTDPAGAAQVANRVDRALPGTWSPASGWSAGSPYAGPNAPASVRVCRRRPRRGIEGCVWQTCGCDGGAQGRAGRLRIVAVVRRPGIDAGRRP
jgi:GGDEF domain-containing protein